MTGTVGVDAISAYGGSASVDVAELFAARGLDPARQRNLGMRRKSVAAPGEDTVAIAATAAAPIVAALSGEERASIRNLVVATETAVDLSKAAATHVHRLLELPRSCRLFEVKQACYGGIAALQTAAALVAAEPGSRALVVAADVAVPDRGSYTEPAQCAASVAVLVSHDPRLVELDPARSGRHSYETADFCRPHPAVDVVDTDLSLMSYLDCLLGAFADYADRVPGADFHSGFDLLAMHTPFPGMVRGAHRTGLRKLTSVPRSAEAEDFERRVAPSLRHPELVGNAYSATTLLAMASAITAAGDSALELGVFSYGSGCSSEFLGARVLPGAGEALRAARFDDELAARTPLPVAEYDAALDAAAEAGFGVRNAGPADLLSGWGAGTRPRAVLTGVRDYRREYAWLPRR